MHDHRLRSAPDYTNPALIMMGVNLMWVFFAIWALFGLLPVVVLALGLNRAINWLAERKARQG